MNLINQRAILRRQTKNVDATFPGLDPPWTDGSDLYRSVVLCKPRGGSGGHLVSDSTVTSWGPNHQNNTKVENKVKTETVRNKERKTQESESDFDRNVRKMSRPVRKVEHKHSEHMFRKQERNGTDTLYQVVSGK